MKNFVGKLRSPSVTVVGRRYEDRSKYVPHYGEKQYLKAWYGVLKRRLKEREHGSQIRNEV
jgi:hypothetical protein